jgi:hypothetical protein
MYVAEVFMDGDPPPPLGLGGWGASVAFESAGVRVVGTEPARRVRTARTGPSYTVGVTWQSCGRPDGKTSYFVRVVSPGARASPPGPNRLDCSPANDGTHLWWDGAIRRRGRTLGSSARPRRWRRGPRATDVRPGAGALVRSTGRRLVRRVPRWRRRG